MSSPGLSAAEMLDAAFLCRDRPAAEAVLHLIALVEPSLSPEACLRLPLGERDAGLTRLYAALFGPRLDLAAACPQCGARLDVSLASDALLVEPEPAPAVEVAVAGLWFGVRPLNSVDLQSVARIDDPALAREVLALRCLVPPPGASVPDGLDEAEIDALAEALSAIDPASDPYVVLACLTCGAGWDAPIDVPRILEGEIRAAADQLIDDVHDLALAYHWSEAEILALGTSRRRAYLQRVRG